jgi:hypothetical protein
VHHHRGGDARLSAQKEPSAVKRSRTIRLLLLGGFSAGALAVSSAAADGRISASNAYVNDHHVPGAGYYHAPYRAFFAQPYNFYDPQRKQYFHGGQWTDRPHRSIVNISEPTPEAALAAERVRIVPVSHSSGYIPRSGFGSTSRRRSIFS